MTEGLVVLFAWLQWAALAGALLYVVLRRGPR